MTSAKVLVALATFAAVPKASSVGKVIRVPPPATALIRPAAAADASNPAISSPDMPGHYALSSQDFRQHAALRRHHVRPQLHVVARHHAAVLSVAGGRLGGGGPGAGPFPLAVAEP